MRALAAAAYRRGARFVDVTWFDPWVKRARIEHAREETLSYVPPWYGERVLALGEHRAARVALSGTVAPGLLADLDPVRAGRDRLPAVKEGIQVVNDRTTNWTIAPCPTPAWAELVLPGPRAGRGARPARGAAPARAAARRGRPDRRLAGARGRARRRRRAPDRATTSTPSTTRARAPTSRSGCCPPRTWRAARFTTVDGIEHMPNLPTEEVFTTPDPERTEGTVTATQAARARRRHRRARPRRPLRGRPRRRPAGLRGRRDAAHDHRDRRGRRPAGRVRARRPRGPHRPARHDLLRHAARRERRQPHRARPGLPVGAGRGGPRPRATAARSTSTS